MRKDDYVSYCAEKLRGELSKEEIDALDYNVWFKKRKNVINRAIKLGYTQAVIGKVAGLTLGRINQIVNMLDKKE